MSLFIVYVWVSLPQKNSFSPVAFYPKGVVPFESAVQSTPQRFQQEMPQKTTRKISIFRCAHFLDETLVPYLKLHGAR